MGEFPVIWADITLKYLCNTIACFSSLTEGLGHMTYHWYQTNLHMNIKISVWICKIKSKLALWIFITFNEIWIKHWPYLRFEGTTLVSCEKLLHILVSIAGADLLNITPLNVILSQFSGHKFRDSPIQSHFPHMKTKPHFDASLLYQVQRRWGY